VARSAMAPLFRVLIIPYLEGFKTLARSNLVYGRQYMWTPPICPPMQAWSLVISLTARCVPHTLLGVS
jgi:hypothetical protein